MAGRRIRRVFDDQRPRMGVRTEFFHQKHADRILLVLLVDLNQNLLHIRVRVGDDDGSVSFLVRIVLDQRVQKHGITQTDGRRNVNRHVASAHRVRHDAPQTDDVEKLSKLQQQAIRHVLDVLRHQRVVHPHQATRNGILDKFLLVIHRLSNDRLHLQLREWVSQRFVEQDGKILVRSLVPRNELVAE